MTDETCPFCGSEELSVSIGDGIEPFDFVCCDDCFAQGPHGVTEEHAEQLWASRTSKGRDGSDCPFCGSSETAFVYASDGKAVVCGSCKTIGPSGPTDEIAMERWRNRSAFQ